MTRAQLIQSIKVKIDELVPENELTIVTSANLSINTISESIDSFLNESAIELLKIAPLHLCPLTANTESIAVSNNIGTIRMPSNYIRFGSVKFNVWGKKVVDFIHVGSPAYNIQNNTYSMAGYKKPVVALGKDSSGYYIECYSVKSSADGVNREILYVGKPISAESILDDTLLSSLQWLVASKVLQAFEKYDAMKAAYEQYQKTLQ